MPSPHVCCTLLLSGPSLGWVGTADQCPHPGVLALPGLVSGRPGGLPAGPAVPGELIKPLVAPAWLPNHGFLLTEAVSSRLVLEGPKPFPTEHLKHNYMDGSDFQIHFTKHFPFYLKNTSSPCQRPAPWGSYLT